MAESLIKSRHWVYMSLISLLFLFAILTRQSIWMYWTVVLIFTTFIFLADILFADFQFIFDPDANNWRRKTEESY